MVTGLLRRHDIGCHVIVCHLPVCINTQCIVVVGWEWLCLALHRDVGVPVLHSSRHRHDKTLGLRVAAQSLRHHQPTIRGLSQSIELSVGLPLIVKLMHAVLVRHCVKSYIVVWSVLQWV